MSKSILIVVLAVILAGAAIIWVSLEKTNQPNGNTNVTNQAVQNSNANRNSNASQNLNINQNTNANTNQNNATAGWIAYTDLNNAFSILYPPTWRFDKDFTIINQGKVLENLPLLSIMYSQGEVGKSFEGYVSVEESSVSVSGVSGVKRVLKTSYHPDFYTEAEFAKYQDKYTINTTFEKDGFHYNVELEFKAADERTLTSYKNDFDNFLEAFVAGR